MENREVEFLGFEKKRPYAEVQALVAVGLWFNGSSESVRHIVAAQGPSEFFYVHLLNQNTWSAYQVYYNPEICPIHLWGPNVWEWENGSH